MTNNSKIYLKGEKEPLICSEKVAKSIKQIFDNSALPYNHHVDIGPNKSFEKGEIRRIWIMPDTPDQNEIKKVWAIVSEKRKAIWKQSFPSRQEAQSCFDFEVINMPPEIRNNLDWEIKEMVAR